MTEKTTGTEIEKMVGDFLGDATPEDKDFFGDEEDFDADIRKEPTDEDDDKTGDDAADDDKDSDDQDDKGSDDDADDDNAGDDDKSDKSDDDDSGSADDDDSSGDDSSSTVSPDVLELRQQLLEQQQAITKLTEALNKKDDDKKDDKPEPDTEYEFVTDKDIDDVLADPAKFNAMMSKAIGTAVKQALGKVSDSIPVAVSGHVNQQFDIRDYVKTFYDENKDLVGVKKTVGTLANEVQAEHTDWTLDKIFEETAKRTRVALGMPADGSGRTEESGDGKDGKKKTDRSALPPGSKSSRKSAGKSSGMQKEIDELL